MMKIDFHVHTIYSRHSLLWKFGLIDGLCTPEEMVKYGKKRGLTAICLTDHNYIHPQRFIKRLSKDYNMLVIGGAEININKQEYIMLGCEKIPPTLSLEEIKEFIHDNNGVLIAPHPKDILGRGFKNFLNHFDAIEVINGFGSIYRGDSYDKAKVTGSDAHIKEMMGYSYTEVEGESYDDLLEAIKKGGTRPIGKPFPKKILPIYYGKKYYTWIKSLNIRHFSSKIVALNKK